MRALTQLFGAENSNSKWYGEKGSGPSEGDGCEKRNAFWTKHGTNDHSKELQSSDDGGMI